MSLSLRDSDLLKRSAFIDGEWCQADDAATLPVKNPATGTTIVEIARVVRRGGTIAVLFWSGQQLLAGHTELEAGLGVAHAASVVAEADAVLRFLGTETRTFVDKGVAGIHRMMSSLPELQTADVVKFASMSLAMGLLSTLYPAWRASRTQPIRCTSAGDCSISRCSRSPT